MSSGLPTCLVSGQGVAMFVCAVFVVIPMALSASSSPPTNLGAVFSLSNLGEYNQLIDCVSNIRNSFIRCNEEAQKTGERVLKYVDEKSDFGQLLKCCGIWRVRDCWTKAAGEKCTREQVAQLEAMPAKFIPGLDRLCEKYPPGSSSCYTPHLIFASIFISIIVLIILVIVAGIFLCRRYRQHHQNGNKLMTLAVKSSGVKDLERDETMVEKARLTSSHVNKDGTTEVRSSFKKDKNTRRNNNNA